MVGLAHFNFAVEAVDLHSFHRQGDLERVGGLGFLEGFGEHRDPGVGGHRVVVVVVLLAEALNDVRTDELLVVRVPVAHEPDLVFARGSHRGGHASGAGIVGVEVGVESGVLGCLDQQREVAAPVAGDDGVRARGLHFGNVGREVLHLRERVQVLADDLDVGALLAEVVLGRLGHGVAERVVLVEEVDVLDLRVLGQERGQRLHLHVRVRVEAEMPEVALAVGQVGVDRGVIQVNDFLSGIALVVLGHGVGQRQRDRRAVALHDVADALVDDLLEHRERFLRGELVVEADDLELGPAGPVLLVGEVGDVLPAVQLVLAYRGHQARQRVDKADFHGLRLCTKCEQGGGGAKGGRADEAIHCLLLFGVGAACWLEICSIVSLQAAVSRCRLW